MLNLKGGTTITLNKKSIHSYVFLVSLNVCINIPASRLKIGLMMFNIVNGLPLGVKAVESYNTLLTRDAEYRSRQLM